MKRGNFVMAISGLVLVALIASYVSPDLRDRLVSLGHDVFGVVMQFRDFVVELFSRT